MALFTRSPRRRRPRIDMISMIDVMFFLVIFFMLFTTFKRNEEGIPVDLPQASSGESVSVTELLVSITEDGTYFLGTETITLSELQHAVAAMIAEDGRVVAFIRGDENTPFRWITAAIEALQGG